MRKALMALAAAFTAAFTFAEGESLAETGGFVTTESQLAFKGITLNDLGTTYLIRARIAGDSISNDGADVQFCNRSETRDGNNALSQVTYQAQSVEPQGDSPWMKCVVLNFTNGEGGVYVSANETTYYHYIQNFTKDMVGGGTSPGTSVLATSESAGGYGVYGFELVTPKANSINVNFHNGYGITTSDTTSQVGAGEYVTRCAQWENLQCSSGASGTFGGATFTIGDVSGSYSASNLQSSNDVRYAYIDESAGKPNPTVTITGIPYKAYRIVVHASTDSDRNLFGYVTIGGVNYSSTYTSTSSATTPQKTVKNSTSAWGNSGGSNSSCQSAEGVNYLVSGIMTGSGTTVTGHRQGGRGCIAAIQIIDDTAHYKEVTVSADKTLSEILSEAGISSDYDKYWVVVTAENNPTITFDVADTQLSRLTVNGAAELKAADSLYEDGSFSKTLLAGELVADDASFAAIRTGWKGQYVKTDSSVTLYAQNAETISINIGGGNGTSDTSADANLVTGNGYYGLYPTPGAAWNNISGQWQSAVKTVTLTSAKAFDGAETTVRNTIQLSGKANNTWLWDGTSVPYLRGYLDDTAGIEVKIVGVPYSKYDVIIYATSDNANKVLNYFTINGVNYTCSTDGVAVEGTATWGAGQTKEPILGKNAMLVRNVEGANLTISGVRTAEGGYAKDRVTVCAVQIINKGSVESSDWSANLNETTTFAGGTGTGLSEQSGTWVNGSLASITLTNKAESATLTLDGEIVTGTLKIVGAAGKKLFIDKAQDATLDIAVYDLTESAEEVVFMFDPDFTKVNPGANRLYCIGYTVLGTPQDGMHYVGANNVFTLQSFTGATIDIGGSGTYSGDVDVYGNANVTFSGNYTASSDAKLAATMGTVTIAEGADVSFSNICLINSGSTSNLGILNIDGTLRITSESPSSNVYGQHNQHNGILLGHYYGSSRVNVGENGQLLADKAWMHMAYTAPALMTVDGGYVKVRGVNGSTPSVQGGQRAASLTLTGGATLEIAQGFVNTQLLTNKYGNATIKTYSYNSSTGWTHPGSIEFTDAADGTTIDPCGMTNVFSGAVSGTGKVVVKDSVGGGSVTFSGTKSATGTLLVDSGSAILSNGGWSGAVEVGANGTLNIVGATIDPTTTVYIPVGASLTVAEGGTVQINGAVLDAEVWELSNGTFVNKNLKTANTTATGNFAFTTAQWSSALGEGAEIDWAGSLSEVRVTANNTEPAVATVDVNAANVTTFVKDGAGELTFVRGGDGAITANAYNFTAGTTTLAGLWGTVSGDLGTLGGTVSLGDNATLVFAPGESKSQKLGSRLATSLATSTVVISNGTFVANIYNDDGYGTFQNTPIVIENGGILSLEETADTLGWNATASLTINEGGTLQVKMRDTLRRPVVLNGGTMTVEGANSGRALDIYNGNTFTVNDDSELVSVATDGVAVPKVYCRNGNVTFDVASGKTLTDGFVYAVGGANDGAWYGIVKTGAGTLVQNTLADTPFTYTGNTAINAGTYKMNATHENNGREANSFTGVYTVADGARLSGTGAITGTGGVTLAAAGSKLAGSLTIKNLTASAGARYGESYDPAENVITGSFTAGGTQTVNYGSLTIGKDCDVTDITNATFSIAANGNLKIEKDIEVGGLTVADGGTITLVGSKSNGVWDVPELTVVDAPSYPGTVNVVLDFGESNPPAAFKVKLPTGVTAQNVTVSDSKNQRKWRISSEDDGLYATSAGSFVLSIF